jgi:hypothetical protein
LVDEVRLEAAAARRVVPFFAVVLREAVLVPLRTVERDAVFRVVRAADLVPRFAAVFFAPVFRAAVFRAAVFLAPARFVALFAPLLAAVFFAPVFRAAVFRAVVFRAAVFLAPARFVALFAPLLAAVFFAPVFRAVVFRAAVFLAPARFVALFAPLLAAVFLAAFFAPAFLAAVFFAPVFFAPVREPVVEDFRGARLLRGAFVGVADSSPVSSGVSVLMSPNQVDLSSVGISASFKCLRVQPSRLHKATSLYQPSSGERKVLEVEFARFLWILVVGVARGLASMGLPKRSSDTQVVGYKGFPRPCDRLSAVVFPI